MSEEGVEIKNDHDLLIKIATQLEILIVDFKSMKSTIGADVENLKFQKADKTDCEKCKNSLCDRLDDHEKKIVSLGNWRYYVVGIGTVMAVLAQVFLRVMFK